MVKPAEEEEDHERQTEVDQRLHSAREEEQVLRHVHLGEYGRVSVQAVHPEACGLGEPAEHEVAAEKVRRVVAYASAEELLQIILG